MASFDLGYPPSQFRSKEAGYNGTPLQSLFAAFPDDESCLRYLFAVRYGLNPVCHRCAKDGTWRRPEWGKHFIHSCGGTIRPLVGTLFERTRIPLQLWFYAMLHIANSAEGINTSFLSRQLGVSRITARRIAARIRWHMAALDHDQPIGAPGEPVFVRLVKVRHIINFSANRQNSSIILLIADESRVDTTILYAPITKEIKRMILSKVNSQSVILTECCLTNSILSKYGAWRPFARYEPLYFSGISGVDNLIRGFLQYFLMSFYNQHKYVHLNHFWLYLKEYEFRYNRRSRSERTFWDMVERFPLLQQSTMRSIERQNFVGDEPCVTGADE